MIALKQTQGAPASQILSFGAARGDLVIPNADLIAAIDSSDEWIRQRTGIITRTRASKGVAAIDMAETAANEAIRNSGIPADRIGAVLVATISNVAVTPSMSSLLTERIGATPAAAYDIGAACAGYVYGIAQADALIRAGVANYVLVVGAEKLSQYVHPEDRSISFLLGDGAGAALLGPSEEPGVSATVWGSDGSKWDAVGMNATFEEYLDKKKPWPTMRQDGPAVFRWAVWEMAKVARVALEQAGVAPENLGAFIPHQGNMRIIDELAKQLKLPETVAIARDIESTGNTSAASIPLATHRLLSENPELSGTLALQIGFGAGLVFGAQVVRLP